MRRAGFRGMAAALIVGLGTVAATTGAEYDGRAPAAKGLLSGLFGEKPRGQAKNAVKASEARPPEPASTIESAHALQQRYQNALLRRMEVCLRLQIIANETGNETLRNQAFELEQRANQLYRLQTAGLPLPAGNAAAVLANEAEQRPGIGDAPPRRGGREARGEQAILNGAIGGGNNP
jgi:hypothetical protein